MTIMSKNPAEYGLDGVAPDSPDKFEVEVVDYPGDLRLVAECVDAPVERLAELNPSLLRRTTPKDQPFQLRLPEGSREKFETAIAAIPKDKRVMWRYYKVQAGDTLATVAKKYHSTERAIASVNNLGEGELAADSKLVIPVSGALPGEGVVSYSRHPSRYKVRRGDTVLSVADDFGVPPEKLRRWNHLKGNDLRRNRVLVVYKPLAPGEVEHVASGKRHKKHHTTTKKPAATRKSASVRKSSSNPSRGTLTAGKH